MNTCMSYAKSPMLESAWLTGPYFTSFIRFPNENITLDVDESTNTIIVPEDFIKRYFAPDKFTFAKIESLEWSTDNPFDKNTDTYKSSIEFQTIEITHGIKTSMIYTANGNYKEISMQNIIYPIETSPIFKIKMPLGYEKTHLKIGILSYNIH